MWGFLQPWSGEINGAQGGQSGRVHLPTQACWVRYSSYRPGGPFNLLSSKPILVDGIGLSFGTFFLDSDAAGIFTFTPRSTFFPSSAARVFHTPLRQSLTPRPPKANKLIHSLSLVVLFSSSFSLLYLRASYRTGRWSTETCLRDRTDDNSHPKLTQGLPFLLLDPLTSVLLRRRPKELCEHHLEYKALGQSDGFATFIFPQGL